MSAASIASAISHWSVQWVARCRYLERSEILPCSGIPEREHLGVPRLNRAIAEEVSPQSLLDAQNSFLAEILGLELGEKPREELKDACAWYMNFLEFKIRQAWKPLFIPVLRGTIDNEEAPPPNNEDISLTFEILKTIVGALGRKNLALTDIVDEIYNKNPFTEADNDRSHANQLVFAALGWISEFPVILLLFSAWTLTTKQQKGSLYSARPDPDPMELQINLPYSASSVPESPHTARRRRRAKKETFTHFSHTLENNDQPLKILFGSFGKVIPQRQRQWVSGRVSPASIAPVRHDDDWIELSLLCFHALNKVANVKIEWVDSLSLHLEFDDSTKVLKVFRLPSLCLLMCYCEKVSPLSQFVLPFHSSPNVQKSSKSKYLSAKKVGWQNILRRHRGIKRLFRRPRRRLGILQRSATLLPPPIWARPVLRSRLSPPHARHTATPRLPRSSAPSPLWRQVANK